MALAIAYKVLTAADVEALDKGVFEGSPIDLADGYIHLSTAEQLTETVRRHFADQTHLSLAAIDIAARRQGVRRHGGVYIAVALLWLWRIDGIAPSRWDVTGAGVALVGMGIIVWGGWRS